MNISLKTYLPRLADLLGVTVGVLYERQRVLVKAGLLSAESGRGPGSGVRLSAESVSLLLIAVLGAETLATVSSSVIELAEATTIDKKPCVITGKKNFKSALAEILINKDVTWKVYSIVVSKSKGTVQINAKEGAGIATPNPATMFASSSAFFTAKIDNTSTIYSEELKSIASSLREALALAEVWKFSRRNTQGMLALTEALARKSQAKTEED